MFLAFIILSWPNIGVDRHYMSHFCENGSTSNITLISFVFVEILTDLFERNVVLIQHKS